jgi:uncharacterized protein (TIGR02118 family)
VIKLVYIVAKRDDVPLDKFYSYWKNNHGPLVRSVAKAIKAKKYIQSHTIDTPVNAAMAEARGMPPAVSGITEVWWDSMADLEAAMATPEGQKAMQTLIDDESTFIDFSKSHCFMTEEHTIFDYAGSGADDQHHAAE